MKKKLIFMELPRLDNDVAGPQENLRLAGVYLRNRLERSAESRHFTACFLPDAAYRLDDAALCEKIACLRPDLVAVTLYLWNIERSLAVLRRLRTVERRLTIMVGGPEVARSHPFLFRSRLPDVAVSGEGEAVWLPIMKAWRTDSSTDFSNVAWKTKDRYRWGRQPPPEMSLCDCLPSPDCAYYRPDTNGMLYLETTRGCPMRCAYCRYHHQRRAMGSLAADETLERVRVFKRRGAREIRFIDPTFNSSPAFEEVIRRLAETGMSRSLKYFAEIDGASVTASQARLLAAACFKEIEVGVQSRSPQVLRFVRRPTNLMALERGIRALLSRKIEVTVDLMVGLPGQTARDVRSSIDWAAGLKGARVQCMQTLLLPGTEIRRLKNSWRLKASDRPPYAVTETPLLNPVRMARTLAFVRNRIGLAADCPTASFIGRRLPDMFPEKIHSVLPEKRRTGQARGRQTRRAWVFHGGNLYACRRELDRMTRAAVDSEPHILWQFVLAPETEEPLDLLDYLIAAMRRFPAHLNDRWIALDAAGRMTARRIFILLQEGRKYDSAWVRAADEVLRAAFY